MKTHSALISAEERVIIPPGYQDFVYVSLDNINRECILQMSIDDDGNGLPLFIPKFKKLYINAKFQNGIELMRTCNKIGLIVPEIKTYINFICIRNMKPLGPTETFNFETVVNRISKFSIRDWLATIDTFLTKLEKVLTETISLMYFALVSTFDLQTEQLKKEIASNIVVFSSAITHMSADTKTARNIGKKYLKQITTLLNNVVVPTEQSKTMKRLCIRDEDLRLARNFKNWIIGIATHMPDFVLSIFATQMIFSSPVMTDVFIPYIEKVYELDIGTVKETRSFMDYLKKLPKDSPNRVLHEYTFEKFNQPHYENLKKKDFANIVKVLLSSLNETEIDLELLDVLCIKLHGINVEELVYQCNVATNGILLEKLFVNDITPNEPIEGLLENSDGTKKTKEELEREKQSLDEEINISVTYLDKFCTSLNFYRASNNTDDEAYFVFLEHAYKKHVRYVNENDTTTISNFEIDTLMEEEFFNERMNSEQKTRLKQIMFQCYRLKHKRDTILTELTRLNVSVNRNYVFEYTAEIAKYARQEQFVLDEIYKLIDLDPNIDDSELNNQFENFMEWYTERGYLSKNDKPNFNSQIERRFPFTQQQDTRKWPLITDKIEEIRSIRENKKKLELRKENLVGRYSWKKFGIGFVIKLVFGLGVLWMLWHFIMAYGSAMTYNGDAFRYLRDDSVVSPEEEAIRSTENPSIANTRLGRWWYGNQPENSSPSGLAYVFSFKYLSDILANNFPDQGWVYSLTGSHFFDVGRMFRNLMNGRGFATVGPLGYFVWRSFINFNELSFGIANYLSAQIMRVSDSSPELFNQEEERITLYDNVFNFIGRVGFDLTQLGTSTMLMKQEAVQMLIWCGMQGVRGTAIAAAAGPQAALLDFVRTTNTPHHLLNINPPNPDNRIEMISRPQYRPRMSEDEALNYLMNRFRNEIAAQNQANNDNDNNNRFAYKVPVVPRGRVQLLDDE